MTLDQARELCRNLFLETLTHLRVGPRLRQVVSLRGHTLEVAGDRFPLHEGHVMRVVSVGKVALEMTHTMAEILEGVRLRGIVVAPEEPPARLPGFEYFAAGHPYPNEQSWRAAEAVLGLLHQKNVSPDDLVLFLISGGGSALLEMPLSLGLAKPDPKVELEDLRRFYEMLVTCGANIEEINTVRKHFSAVKGGRLAQAAYPARQLTLYVSDVPEHLPSMIASGPTMPDESTLEDCRRILSRHRLWKTIPVPYRILWRADQLPETPKPGQRCFARSSYYCLLSNRDAVEKWVDLARAKDIQAFVDTSCDDWEYQRAANYLLTGLEALRQQYPHSPVALVSGGELSCPVTGSGVGGRNQAFVLYCVSKISGQSIVVLSAGTDGIDGNSPAAGAIADGASLERARSLNLDPESYLRQSDAYPFFEKLGDAIVTGPTGTNVRDLRILLVFPASP
ncbi:MAG: DUF4147 domain-containing protein [Acidobacteria bacterium]|nr:DUF4147 domain-containing protein [Acidobacteriota bacterium]